MSAVAFEAALPGGRRAAFHALDPAADLELVAGWMRQPHVAPFWELDVPEDQLAAYLWRAARDDHQQPLVGCLDGEPMSYWEVYWAARDPLARHYRADPFDQGVHLLIGAPELTGQGLGPLLLDAVVAWALAREPRTRRVVAEPDARNHRALRAFARCGFRVAAEIALPEKRAALVVRSRVGPSGADGGPRLTLGGILSAHTSRARPATAGSPQGQPPAAGAGDLLGVGIGPFNLSLAALLDGVPEVRATFCEQAPAFSWHPGLLLEGTTTQVPFLADLVTLADPTSPHSFLSYLHARDRLYKFYFLERFQLPRREYDDYCRWVAGRLPSCRFGERVEQVRWRDRERVFEAEVAPTGGGRARRRRARNLVLGVGTVPDVPAWARGADPKDLFHSAELAWKRERLRRAGSVVVVGSGQSGAEVFLELLREQPACGYRLEWLTRSAGFFPLESSKLALEHFTPDYTGYFHALPAAARERLVAGQALLYKGIDQETVAEIYRLLYERTVGGARPPVRLLPHVEVRGLERAAGAWRLACRQWEQGRDFTVTAECAVLATGYRAELPACIDGLRPRIRFDGAGRYQVGLDYRVATDEGVGGLFVQNAELHTHGVGTPDLGLGAHRAATIANAVAGHAAYRLPARAAFTDFGT